MFPLDAGGDFLDQADDTRLGSIAGYSSVRWAQLLSLEPANYASTTVSHQPPARRCGIRGVHLVGASKVRRL